MKNLKIVSLIVSVLVLSACGSSVSGSSATGTSADTTGGSGVAGATPTPGNGNIYNLPVAPTEDVQLTGNGGGAFTQSLQSPSSTTLNVQVVAQNAPNLTVAPYTNWVFDYGCMEVTVTVNGVTQSTGVLQVPGTQPDSVCPNAPSSVILSFNNLTGNGPVTVTYSNAQYDNCREQMPYIYGCGMTAVWNIHRVAFATTIQSDGYYMAGSPN